MSHRTVRALSATLGVATIMAASVGCGVVRSGSASDYPDYPSVEDLTQAADVVVLGTISKQIGTEFDRGGNSEGSVGIPMKFHDVTVTQVLAGDVDKSLVLAWIDHAERPEEGLSDVKAGQQTLLFLERRTPAEAPGIKSQDEFYVPVGGDNGVFDVDGDIATARSQNVTAMRAADLTSDRAEDLASKDAFMTEPVEAITATVEQSLTGTP